MARRLTHAERAGVECVASHLARCCPDFTGDVPEGFDPERHISSPLARAVIEARIYGEAIGIETDTPTLIEYARLEGVCGEAIPAFIEAARRAPMPDPFSPLTETWAILAALMRDEDPENRHEAHALTRHWRDYA